MFKFIRNKLAGIRSGASEKNSDYQERVAQELANFDNCTNVHELPEIFHYWSNKHLAPVKFHQFGITDPEQFFFLYSSKFRKRFPDKAMLMVSLGCGNCDMEARLARRLLDDGISNFRIECIDINETMLQRGKEHAENLEVGDYIFPRLGDFNSWQPDQTYDLVLANQCLHHVVELENLFDAIKSALSQEGYFLTSDMIGRNGHL